MKNQFPNSKEQLPSKPEETRGCYNPVYEGATQASVKPVAPTVRVARSIIPAQEEKPHPRKLLDQVVRSVAQTPKFQCSSKKTADHKNPEDNLRPLVPRPNN